MIKIFCGKSVDMRCWHGFHPITEVERAIRIVDIYLTQKFGSKCTCYSNSSDFISAIKKYAEKKGVEIEFFLDGISCGSDIEPFFEDFNKALKMIDEI